MRTVLICGDRAWANRRLTEDVMTVLHRLGFDRLLHGAAPGADTVASQTAAKQNWRLVSAFPAQWSTYGKGAGPIRNRTLIKQKPDLVIAFHDDISRSKGTLDVLDQAERSGIPHILISSKQGGIATRLVEGIVATLDKHEVS